MPEGINKELLNCVYKNDVKGVAEAISRGADINYANLHGETALHLAAINGHQELTKLLLSKNPRIQQKDNIGLTPLDWANRRSQTDVVIEIKFHQDKEKQYQERWDSVYNTLDSVYKAGAQAVYDRGSYAYDIIDRLAKDLVGEPSREDVQYQSRASYRAEQSIPRSQEDTTPSKSKTTSPLPKQQKPQASSQTKDQGTSWGAWGAEKLYNI